MSKNLEPLYISTGQPADGKNKFFPKSLKYLLLSFLILFIGCSSKKVYFTTDSSDELLHDSIVVINSPLYDRDIYFYAYKNRLYQNVAFDNEDRKDTRFRFSMTNGKVTEDNPYIGIYRALRDSLIIGLPERYINDDYIINGKNNRISIDSCRKVRENLYEGCIRIYDDKLSCSENKVYIIKKPERCYYEGYRFTCLNQQHIDLYQNNEKELIPYLNSKSIDHIKPNKKLTQIYRKILRSHIQYAKFEKMQSTVGELNADNIFYPIDIMFEITGNMKYDSNAINSIFNSKELAYHKTNKHDIQVEREIKNDIDIAPMSNMQNIKNDSNAQHIKNLDITINWLLSNGKVYIGNKYNEPKTNELGNVYLPQKFLEKYSEEELSLIIRHEAYHATAYISNIIIKLSSQQLKDYDVSLWDKIWHGKDFDNFSKKTENRVKKSEEIGNGFKEINADESVIRFFYENKMKREKYCSLISTLSDNKQRIEYCKVTNKLIDNYFFTKYYNESVISRGAIAKIIDKVLLLEKKKKANLSSIEELKKEENLINFSKIKKQQQRMQYLSSTQNLTKYKYLFMKKIYYTFYNSFIFGAFEEVFKELK